MEELKIPKDKEGNQLTWAEWKERLKGGIEDITPLQQTKVSINGNVLVLIGVVIGLITTFMNQMWWLFIVLIGSLFITGMGFLAILQKYNALVKINKTMEELDEQNEEDEQESPDGA